jgi:hypothetical protein
MTTNSGTLLNLLEDELQFLESGGFRHCPFSPWCAPHNFNEYASCQAFANIGGIDKCKNCGLMQFIAIEHQEDEIPCRFVQLTASGATIDSLRRYGTPRDLEQTMRWWLNQRIHELKRVQPL